MSKKLLCVLLCVITVAGIFAGCGSKEGDSRGNEAFSIDNVEIGYDGLPFFNVFSSITKSEKGYYYYDESMYFAGSNMKPAKYLMFFDPNTRSAVPVCSRADCTHGLTVGCDAVFFLENQDNYIGNVDHLWYYDGDLYTVAGNFEDNVYNHNLYRISADGSKRTKLTKLFSGGVEAFNLFFHRGCLYISFINEEGKNAVYKVKVEKDAEMELIYELDNADGFISDFNIYDTGITFMTGYFEDENYENSVEELKYYNPLNNEVTTLMEGVVFDSYTIIGDWICYTSDRKLGRYDIKNKKTEDFYTCEYPCYVSYDGKYIYAEASAVLLEDYSQHNIYVLDLEGKLVDTINAPSYQDCYFGDDKFLFQMFDLDETLKNKAKKPCMKAFDKSQIGTGKHEWIELPLEWAYKN